MSDIILGKGYRVYFCAAYLAFLGTKLSWEWLLFCLLSVPEYLPVVL